MTEKNLIVFKLKFLLATILLLTFWQSIAQNEVQLDSTNHKKIKMTSLAFGGTGVLFTKVKSQTTVMTGGRGSATFNNRYTFGGGGWGMPKGIELESSKVDTFDFFKFGYGGLEFGYIIYPNEKIKFGTNLLIACGLGFKETLPKSKNGNLKMFPLFEPSLYSQISLSKLLRIDIGITYRFITNTNYSYISNKQLSGFSCYVAFLVGTCKCD
ncbi:MAG: hypothetical protein GYA62_04005 [Bacteroidales bacterium]|nr:hypothetical protein [Bacteroidales bacterium]